MICDICGDLCHPRCTTCALCGRRVCNRCYTSAGVCRDCLRGKMMDDGDKIKK